jgi:hypothetical protein
MKTQFVVLFCLLLSATLCLSQPVGTWYLVSGKGTGADGAKFTFDESSVRETKIVTSTHFMLIRQIVKGDSVKFDWSVCGSVKMEGNNYIETIQHSSNPDFANVKTNFTYKVEGDKYTQAGTIELPGGDKIIVDELVFQRVKAVANPKNKSIGVWDQLSSKYKNFDGVEGSHTNATAIRFEIITPTHWMRMNRRDGKFEGADFGTYREEGKKVFRDLHISSGDTGYWKNFKFDIEQEVKGDQRFVKGIATTSDGKSTLTWSDVFQRIDKTGKTKM